MCVCQFLKWNICLYADGTDTGEGEKLIISERGVKVSWSAWVHLWASGVGQVLHSKRREVRK